DVPRPLRVGFLAAVFFFGERRLVAAVPRFFAAEIFGDPLLVAADADFVPLVRFFPAPIAAPETAPSTVPTTGAPMASVTRITSPVGSLLTDSRTSCWATPRPIVVLSSWGVPSAAQREMLKGGLILVIIPQWPAVSRHHGPRKRLQAAMLCEKPEMPEPKK